MIRVLLVVGAGGALGALARWAVGLAFPHPAGAFPWSTFAINVLGCLLMGVLIVEITEVRRAHPLVRPFAGTGVLGGFTTFSTYATDTDQLVAAGRITTALLYAGATLVVAVVAVAAGSALARRAHR
jgi:fluoride exporter